MHLKNFFELKRKVFYLVSAKSSLTKPLLKSKAIAHPCNIPRDTTQRTESQFYQEQGKHQNLATSLTQQASRQADLAPSGTMQPYYLELKVTSFHKNFKPL
jgi:hypothetical protein